MIISLNRVKLLAIITAIIVIPFIGINLINNILSTTSTPASKITAQPTNESNLPAITQPIAVVQDSGVLSEYRIARDQIRSKEVTQLEDISKNINSTSKARDAAYLKLVNILDREQKEIQAEAMIKSQGFQDCAVVVTDSTTTVMVEVNSLAATQEEVIKKTASIATGSTEKTISVVKLQQPPK
jgi:stage III sporulation protein AH